MILKLIGFVGFETCLLRIMQTVDLHVNISHSCSGVFLHLTFQLQAYPCCPLIDLNCWLHADASSVAVIGM